MLAEPECIHLGRPRLRCTWECAVGAGPHEGSLQAPSGTTRMHRPCVRGWHLCAGLDRSLAERGT